MGASRAEHHFVPRFYLRNFATRTDGGAIRLFQISAGRHISQASIRGQCARRHLYGQDGSIEQAFVELEGIAASVIRGMTVDEHVPPPLTVPLFSFQIFVVLQESRTISAAERYNAARTKIARAHFASDPSAPAELLPYLDSLHVSYGEQAVVLALRNAIDSLPVVYDLRLKVLRNGTAVEFITSDSPVVLHNHWARRFPGEGVLGLASSGLQVFFPLSPTHLAVLYDTDVYKLGEYDEDVILLDEVDGVRSLNALQGASARENLYYASEFMRAEIDSMSLVTPRPSEEAITVTTIPDPEGGGPFIVQSRRPLDVELMLPVMRVRDEVRSVPHRRRRSLRPEASKIANLVRQEVGAEQKG